jgi:predicted transcriptional regulator
MGIMAEMLSFCREPQTKTRVMYHSNLSWKALQKHLSILESEGLLRVHHSPIKYVTTEKGLRFVETWSQLIELLPSLEVKEIFLMNNIRSARYHTQEDV